MFKIGQIVEKENYTRAAVWCNQNGAHIEKQDGQYVIVKNAPAPEPTYAEKRAAEYPSVADQLDMMYWDKQNGTNIWAETVAAVKEKYPKPTPVLEKEMNTPEVSAQTENAAARAEIDRLRELAGAGAEKSSEVEKPEAEE